MEQNELIEEMKQLLAAACEDIKSLLQGSPVNVNTCEKCGMLSVCNADVNGVCTVKTCKWKHAKKAQELIVSANTLITSNPEPKKLQDYEQLEFEF